jgi:hypothetical protein
MFELLLLVTNILKQDEIFGRVPVQGKLCQNFVKKWIIYYFNNKKRNLAYGGYICNVKIVLHAINKSDSIRDKL